MFGGRLEIEASYVVVNKFFANKRIGRAPLDKVCVCRAFCFLARDIVFGGYFKEIAPFFVVFGCACGYDVGAGENNIAAFFVAFKQSRLQ